MLNIVHTDVHQCDSGWVPVYTDAQKTLAIMSIGFLLEDPDEAVVWRGPKKTGMLFPLMDVFLILSCSLALFYFPLFYTLNSIDWPVCVGCCMGGAGCAVGGHTTRNI